MIKHLKNLNKLIEGVLWLYLPIVLFYWGLTLINLNAIVPFRLTVGIIIQPFVQLINQYYSFSYRFGDTIVDYTPLVFAGILFLIVIGLGFNAKLLDLVADKIENEKIRLRQEKERKKVMQDLESKVEDLKKHKIIYVILKVTKNQHHDTYLVKDEKDLFSVGLLDSYELSLVNIAKTFQGKYYKEYKTENNVYSFIFADQEKFLTYLSILFKKVDEVNKGIAELNTVFAIEVACHCSYSATSANVDLNLTSKVLNLCGKGEILVTELLKEKLETSETTASFSFEPKGIYILNEKHIDIFKLKIE